MTTENLIALNILIGDRTYRIKGLPKDEEAIRRTLKTINDKIIEFKTNFAGKDMQDYIAMVLIWYATQSGNAENASNDVIELRNALNKIDSLLDKTITGQNSL